MSLRAGANSLMFDLSLKHALDKASLASFLQTIVAAQAFITEFLITKTGIIGVEAVKKEGLKNFSDLAAATCDQIVGAVTGAYDACEALAALSVASSTQAVSSNRASALGIALAINSGETGRFYPVSLASSDKTLQALVGDSSLMQSLARTVISHGSDIVVASIAGLVGENNRVTGVELDIQGREILASCGVVSGLGAIHSYTKLMPGQPLSAVTAGTLAKLVEARPKIKVLFWLEGTVSSLGLSTADYIEIGSQPRDSDSSAFTNSYVCIWSPSAKDAGWTEVVQTLVVEFEVDDTLVALKSTALSVGGMLVSGPQVYESISRTESDAATHELYLSKGQLDHYTSRAEAKLLALYPLAAGKVVHQHVLPPVLGGHRVAEAASKYSTALHAASDIQVNLVVANDCSVLMM